MDAAAVAQFTKAIEALKVRTLDRTELEDRRSARIVAFAENKWRAGTDVITADAGAGDVEKVEESVTNVVDLMDVLRERLRGKLRERSAPAGETNDTADELEAKNKTELYELAQSMDISGRSAMFKAELIDALQHQSR